MLEESILSLRMLWLLPRVALRSLILCSSRPRDNSSTETEVRGMDRKNRRTFFPRNLRLLLQVPDPIPASLSERPAASGP